MQDNELQKAIETLNKLQFWFAAICASKWEMSRFERDVISAIEVVLGRLQ